MRKSPSSSFSSSFDEEYQPTVKDERRPPQVISVRINTNIQQFIFVDQAFGGPKDGFTTDSTINGDDKIIIDQVRDDDTDYDSETKDDIISYVANKVNTAQCVRYE